MVANLLLLANPTQVVNDKGVRFNDLGALLFGVPGFRGHFGG
jgi:hypothetical protein